MNRKLLLLITFATFILCLPRAGFCQTATPTATPFSTAVVPPSVNGEQAMGWFAAPWGKVSPINGALVMSSPAAAATPSIALTATPPIQQTVYLWELYGGCVGGSAAGTIVLKGGNQTTDATFEIAGGQNSIAIPLLGLPGSAVGQPAECVITGGSGATGCSCGLLYVIQ
jgi:hypothetical protein